VDKGPKPLANGSHPDECYTDGITDLRERIAFFKSHGARFAKWRAIFYIRPFTNTTSGVQELTPSNAAIQCNANLLAGFASICQEHGLVPIVEPEVMMDGDFTIEVAAKATEAVLTGCYEALIRHNVFLEGNSLCWRPEVPLKASQLGRKTRSL
jgi:fructose-bisphosphate aldolase class I